MINIYAFVVLGILKFLELNNIKWILKKVVTISTAEDLADQM